MVGDRRICERQHCNATFGLVLSLFSFGCTVGNKTEFFQSASLTEEEFQERPIINWDAILWVNRPVELWAVQLLLALISLSEALLLTYLGYKGNIWQQILSFHFILELVTTIPFALTVSVADGIVCLLALTFA